MRRDYPRYLAGVTDVAIATRALVRTPTLEGTLEVLERLAEDCAAASAAA